MAGLARLDLLPPVVMYDEHWANIVLAGADGVEGGGGGTRPDRRSIDLPHFVTLCRRAPGIPPQRARRAPVCACCAGACGARALARFGEQGE